jgi:hypothetical protein
MKDQLREICGFEVLIATISRTMRRQGFTRKKVGHHSPVLTDMYDPIQHYLGYMPFCRTWRRWPRCLQDAYRGTFPAGAPCICRWMSFQPNFLLPWFAWAPIGQRAWRRDFFIRSKRYFAVTLLSMYWHFVRYSNFPALSLNSILHLEVLDHSFSGEEFGHFVSGVLDQMQPWPMPWIVTRMKIHIGCVACART